MELTVEAVRQVFEDVLNGKISREEADQWARSVMQAAEVRTLTFYPSRDRERIWAGVMYLNGGDLMIAPGQYLHTEEEIRDAMIRKLGAWNKNARSSRESERDGDHRSKGSLNAPGNERRNL